MHVRRDEYPNYTRAQIEQHVRDALEVVEGFELSDEERVALLPMILEKLSSKQITLEAVEMHPNMVVPRGLG